VDAEAQFRSLAEPWADTATSTGRLMIAILGGFADVERDFYPHTHRQSGAAGRRRAGSTWAAPQSSRRSSMKKARRRRRAQGATLKELASIDMTNGLYGPGAKHDCHA
jgi:DNA invertase Pin-like site-specific DNA recombinase